MFGNAESKKPSRGSEGFFDSLAYGASRAQKYFAQQVCAIPARLRMQHAMLWAMAPGSKQHGMKCGLAMATLANTNKSAVRRIDNPTRRNRSFRITSLLSYA
jgi:hypothetical protein